VDGEEQRRSREQRTIESSRKGILALEKMGGKSKKKSRSSKNAAKKQQQQQQQQPKESQQQEGHEEPTELKPNEAKTVSDKSGVSEIAGESQAQEQTVAGSDDVKKEEDDSFEDAVAEDIDNDHDDDDGDSETTKHDEHEETEDQQSDETEDKAVKEEQSANANSEAEPEDASKETKRALLNQSLATRPEQASLEDKGVLKTEKGLSNNLAQTAQELKKQMCKDQVGQLLEERPDIDELKRRGMHSGLDVAPSLQERRNSLERQIHADKVSRNIEMRPEVAELERTGVLPEKSSEEHIAPSLVRPKMELERSMRKDSLSRILSDRPDPKELEAKGILPQNPDRETPSQAQSQDQIQQQEEEDYLMRSRFAIALKGALHLEKLGLINAQLKGILKDLIFDEDERIMAAVEVFEMDHEVNEMLDTMLRVLKNHLNNLMG